MYVTLRERERKESEREGKLPAYHTVEVKEELLHPPQADGRLTLVWVSTRPASDPRISAEACSV